MITSISWYDFVTTKTVSEFEEGFKRWVETNKSDTDNTVIIFDESEFRKILDRLLQSVDVANKEPKCGMFFNISCSGNTKTILHDLGFEWKNLGDDKCVLKRIYTNTNHTVYEAPTSWQKAKSICWICNKITGL